MKKILFICILFCMFLTGCSVTTNTKENIKTFSLTNYDDHKLALNRTIKNKNFQVEMECENYRETPICTYKVFKNKQEIKGQDKILYDVHTKLIKHEDILQIKENVYYFDKNDSNNHFAYNQITNVYFLDKEIAKQNEVEAVGVGLTKELKWEILDVLKAFLLSIKTGVYSLETICAFYRYVLLFSTFVLLYHIIKIRYKNAILQEIYKPIFIIDICNVILLFFISINFLIVNVKHHISIYMYNSSIGLEYTNLLLITIVFVLLVLRFYYMKKILEEWINNPPKPYTGHLWLLNVHKKR